MFTGLVEEIGTIISAVPRGGLMEIRIRASKVMEGLKTDDSVNIQGVCQTVVKRTHDTFFVQSVRETLNKTTLGSLRAGNRVNLERALLPSTRLGGHFVQGHVDGTAKVISLIKESGDWRIRIEIPDSFLKYVVPMGSICVDGVSLTIAEVKSDVLTMAIIPHTLEVTTLKDLKPGSVINIELDMIGKYIVNLAERSGKKTTV